jgi:predicted GNAT family acetyltransferase
MAAAESQPEIVDRTAEGRFGLEEDDAVAELIYELEGDTLVLVHTGVPDELGGRGIAGRLVAAGVDRARRDGLTIAPVCPYARRWLEGHADQTEGVTIDWSVRPAAG